MALLFAWTGDCISFLKHRRVSLFADDGKPRILSLRENMPGEVLSPECIQSDVNAHLLVFIYRRLLIPFKMQLIIVSIICHVKVGFHVFYFYRLYSSFQGIHQSSIWKFIHSVGAAQASLLLYWKKHFKNVWININI